MSAAGRAEFGLDYLYDQQLSKLKKHDAEAKMARLYDERFPVAVDVGVCFIDFRDCLFKQEKKCISMYQKYILAFSFYVIFFVPSIVFASVAGEVNKANDLYKQGKFDDSLDLYQKALDQDDKSSVVKYDLGTALYKKGDYEKALEYLEQACPR